ncbi:MAG: hypothetical protein DI582_01190 [Azospirillum brasilense]|nr:MAG: hypothetical protein DI582_01190 [Azospirillum brasilense]
MLWRLQRKAGQPPQLTPVDPQSLHHEAGKRRVILFPGAGVWDRSEPRTLAGSIKYVEQTLTGTTARGDADIDILLMTYELPYEDYYAKRPHYQRNATQQSHYGRMACDHALLPLLLGEGERVSHLTPEVLKERLSQVTLIGHSYGSIVMQDLANSLAAKLRMNGWEEPTIADTLKECVGIAVAPIARTDFPAPNFTQYFFTSINDMTAVDSIRRENPDTAVHIPLLKSCGYERISNILQRHDGKISRADLLAEAEEEVNATRKPGRTPRATLQKQPSGYVLSAMLPDKEIRWMEKRPDGTDICRMLNAHTAERDQTAVVHDYRTYLHGHHKLGEVLINVANNAVQREPGIGDGHRLMFTTELTQGQHARRYEGSKRAEVSERGIA